MALVLSADNPATPSAPLREAPHNIEAEQALLGAILANNEALNHVGSALVAEDFYAEIHQRIYKAIQQFHNRGMIANPVTLKHHFTREDGIEDAYLARLVAASTTIINVHDYSNIIHDLATKRALIGIGEQVVNRAFDHRDEASGIEQVENAEQLLFSLATDGDAEGQFKALKYSLADAIQRTENAFRMNGAVVGISTGLTDLNSKLGGLHKSDLIILAGRPSMGKTALATNIAYNAAKWMHEEDAEKIAQGEKGRSVGFFSLEMSGEQLAMRLLASAANIPSHKLARGELTNEEFATLSQRSIELSNMPFHIDDTPALSISAVRTRARRLKRQHNLALLVVDYLQLIRPSSNKSQANRVQEISEITQGLKAIAKELDIPVIALSQLSRAVEQRPDKRPQLADLRESGSIEQDADLVMFVFREEYYTAREEPRPDTQEHTEWQSKMEKIHGLAQVIIAKHRNGPIGVVDLQFQSDLTRFEDLARDGYFPEHNYE
ncbi:MAG: replicative DNA helicase [Alphaproteobacteria bacterium]|nr:replicative DNA helicase [Alphaproteobacteria bacterium]